MAFKTFTIVFLLGISGMVSCATARQTSSRTSQVITIYIPADADKVVSESANDMAYWLNKAGAGSFVVVGNNRPPAAGIRLVTTDHSNLPASQLSEIKANGQAFHLFATGVSDAVITGTGSNSLVNGIYTFLHELGFRWYMPGDNWVKLGDVNKSIRLNKIVNPSFSDRIYAGSGGANQIPGLDANNNFRADFLLWNRRNRFNGDYPALGHQGIAFYNANKTELDKHPEYFCDRKPTRNAKLNFDNPALVKLYTNWIFGQLKAGSRFPVASVEPADGSGGEDDCLPVTIPGIKTWSDKYFWMANQVAQNLPAAQRDARITMYAYNKHADPPGFRLHPNVFPVIIPYAFQRSTSAFAFIESWRQRMQGQPMGIYDYWNISQWSQCLPQLNVHELDTKLRLWKQSNITSINLESTYAKGPMGHAMWLASQKMWNIDLDWNALYSEFLDDLFEEAAGDVRRMYDRWSRGYLGAADIILSCDDLQKASEKARKPVVKERLTELKAYLRFLKLHHEYTENKTVEKYDQLIRYIMSVHHWRLLHTSALVFLYIPKPKGYKTVSDKTEQARLYGAIKPLTLAQAERNFDNDRRSLPKPFPISGVKFDLARVSAAPPADKPNIPLYINNQNTYSFQLTQTRKLLFKAGATVATSLCILNQVGDTVLRKDIQPAKTGYADINITLAAGVYRLIFGEGQRFSRIEFPAGLAVITGDRNYDNAGFPLQYVYVPSDVTEIVYEDVFGPGLNRRGNWRQPDGKTVQPEKVFSNVYRVPVPASFRGKVWTLNIGHRQFRMLNIPDYYSLNPFTYTEK